jgi:hypothetical protein
MFWSMTEIPPKEIQLARVILLIGEIVAMSKFYGQVTGLKQVKG